MEMKDDLTKEQIMAQHEKEQNLLLEKINRVSKSISEILDKEGLTLTVKHNIVIVPRQ